MREQANLSRSVAVLKLLTVYGTQDDLQGFYNPPEHENLYLCGQEGPQHALNAPKHSGPKMVETLPDRELRNCILRGLFQGYEFLSPSLYSSDDLEYLPKMRHDVNGVQPPRKYAQNSAYCK